MPHTTPNKGINTNRQKKGSRPDGNVWLFIVGINNYSGVPPLNNARTDAEAVRDVLLQSYQFSSDYLVELYDAQASMSNIYGELLALTDKVKENDSLLVYFSGHGEYKEALKEGYWIPVEGQGRDHSTFMPFSSILKHIEAIDSFHTLIIADSCYAGGMFTYRAINSEVYDRMDRFPSRWLLTAGRNEVVPDGPPGTHSPFADQLLYFLRHNDQGLLSIAELGQQLVRAVGQGRNPTPRCEPLHVQGHRGGEFVFRSKNYIETPTQAPVYEPEQAPVQRNLHRPEPTAVIVQPEEPELTSFASVRALKKAAITLIMRDNLRGCLDLLNETISMTSYNFNMLIQTQARLADWERLKQGGTRTGEQLNVQRNQIREAITYMINELEESDIEEGKIQA